MEKFWTMQVEELPSFLILDEKRLEENSCIFSICTSLQRGDLFTLPLPELELGMVFSISANPVLAWEFESSDLSLCLTVRDAYFSTERKVAFAGKKRSIRNHTISSASLQGRKLCARNCVFRL